MCSIFGFGDCDSVASLALIDEPLFVDKNKSWDDPKKGSFTSSGHSNNNDEPVSLCFEVMRPEGISTYHENDILMGRGGKNNQHSGNEKLRILARERRDMYRLASKKDKSVISRDLVHIVHNMSPPGRFLKKNANTGLWEDVGDDVAREKASQALRDAVADKTPKHVNSLSAVTTTFSSSPNNTVTKKEEKEKMDVVSQQQHCNEQISSSSKTSMRDQCQNYRIEESSISPIPEHFEYLDQEQHSAMRSPIPPPSPHSPEEASFSNNSHHCYHSADLPPYGLPHAASWPPPTYSTKGSSYYNYDRSPPPSPYNYYHQHHYHHQYYYHHPYHHDQRQQRQYEPYHHHSSPEISSPPY